MMWRKIGAGIYLLLGLAAAGAAASLNLIVIAGMSEGCGRQADTLRVEVSLLGLYGLPILFVLPFVLGIFVLRGRWRHRARRAIYPLLGAMLAFGMLYAAALMGHAVACAYGVDTGWDYIWQTLATVSLAALLLAPWFVLLNTRAIWQGRPLH